MAIYALGLALEIVCSTLGFCRSNGLFCSSTYQSSRETTGGGDNASWGVGCEVMGEVLLFLINL